MTSEQVVEIEDDFNAETIEGPAKRPTVQPASRRLLQRRRGNNVQLKADFSLPIDRLARLAEEEPDDDEDFAETELDLLEPVALPFQQNNSGDSVSTDEYLRQLQETNRVKAHIWRVPKLFAERNPLITRKPASAPGWAFQGEIPFSPDTLDNDLLTLFADGYYFVEVRERGRFKASFLKTIGNPSNPQTDPPIVPAPQVIVQEPAPASDPIKDAKAQILVMNSVVTAATRLLEAQATAQNAPPPKQPTLKERIEELKALQQLVNPPQAQQPQRDPMERFAEALESEALKKILSAVKSDNPVVTEPPTSFWDFAAQAAEYLAPGLNPLLAGLGAVLMNQLQGAQPQQPALNPTRAQQPRQQALAGAQTNQRAEPANTASPDIEAEAINAESQTEEEGVDIRFLLVDLFNQAPVTETAVKINDLTANKPFIRPFLKQYLAMPNEEIFAGVLDLCESEAEAQQVRQALAACAWKDEWLNNLKGVLTGGDNAEEKR